MNATPIFILPVVCTLLSGTLASGGDLAEYRGYRIGMDLATVARLARTDPSAVKTIHQRPALIQEIEWQPSLFGAQSQDEAIYDVRFSFYNGGLFQIAVKYDRYRTDGMSSGDLIEALSGLYGVAVRVSEARSPSEEAYSRYRAETIARWGDADYTVSLMRSEFGPTFGLILLSNRVDALARTAIAEAARLDLQEAPQREAERLKKQAEDDRVAQDRARQANKSKFRP